MPAMAIGHTSKQSMITHLLIGIKKLYLQKLLIRGKEEKNTHKMLWYLFSIPWFFFYLLICFQWIIVLHYATVWNQGYQFVHGKEKNHRTGLILRNHDILVPIKYWNPLLTSLYKLVKASWKITFFSFLITCVQSF